MQSLSGQAAPDSTQAADAAVVIVNYRTPKLVEQCVASLKRNAGDLVLDTIVVDNASEDGSVERLRGSLPEVNVIAMPSNRGFGAGVNVGFQNSSAEIVVVLNPDTELRDGALHILLQRLAEQPKAGVVAPLLEGHDGQIAPNGYRRFPTLPLVAFDMCLPLGYVLVHMPSLNRYVLPPAALLAGRRPAWVCGAAMAIRRGAYAQAGPLDERFFLYFEETEWQQRTAKHGWISEVAPNARARHLIRGGGELSLSPSPHFIVSAIRYLRLQGVPVKVSQATLALALATSCLTLRAISCLPSKRERASMQARAYGSLVALALRHRFSPEA